MAGSIPAGDGAWLLEPRAALLQFRLRLQSPTRCIHECRCNELETEVSFNFLLIVCALLLHAFSCSAGALVQSFKLVCRCSSGHDTYKSLQVQEAEKGSQSFDDAAGFDARESAETISRIRPEVLDGTLTSNDRSLPNVFSM
jgi:hypothetical protein